jgi:hypothetical protein
MAVEVAWFTMEVRLVERCRPGSACAASFD